MRGNSNPIDSLEFFLTHLYERSYECYPDDKKMLDSIKTAIADVRKIRQLEDNAKLYAEIINAMAETLMELGYCPQPDIVKQDIIEHFTAGIQEAKNGRR